MPSTVGYVKNSKISRRLSKDLEKKLAYANDSLLFGQMFRQKQRETPWMDSYHQYMNQIGWDVSGDPTADVVNVNVSFSTINTILPFVADEKPVFVIEPYSGDASAQNAELLQSFLNRLWESDKVQGQVHLRDAAFDYLLYGDGFIQVGYQIIEDTLYDAAGNEIEGRGPEIAEFSVERVNPWDVWVDPYANGVHDARWVCRRLYVPANELEEDDRYKILYPDSLAGSMGAVGEPAMAPEEADRFDYFYAAGGWVALYEFYNIKKKWMLTFLQGGGTPLRYIEGIKCPIVQFPNYRIPNSPYHIGELENIRQLQEELNKTRSQMITHRRRNVMKWMYRRDRIGEDAIEGMQSEAINATIPIDGAEPFERLLQPIAPTPLGQDAYMMDGQIKTDINEITGVNEYLRGSPPDIRRTATEAAIIEGATNVRTRHKLLDIEQGSRMVGQLLLDIMTDVIPETDYQEMSQFITGRESERLNRALGVDNIMQDNVLTPVPEIFAGKYVVFVERGSTELRNPQVKAQKLREVAQILLNSAEMLQALGVFINLKQALEIWLKAEGISDVEALLTPDEEAIQMQQQQQMQQLQMEQMMAQAGAAQGGVPPQGAVGAPVAAGQPREAAAQPPTESVTPENSGMTEARQY